MKIPDIPQEMNWADYWDALWDEYFELRQSLDSHRTMLSELRPDDDARDDRAPAQSARSGVTPTAATAHDSRVAGAN